MGISKIINLVADGSYSSQYGENGVMHTSIVTFEDGATGQVSHKKQTPPYAVGDEMQYTEKGEYNGLKKYKVEKPNDFNRPQTNAPVASASVSSSNNKSFALSYAKDIYCAYIQAGKVIPGDQQNDVDNLIEYARKLQQYMDS